VAGYTKMVYPQTVTHPSINRARRRPRVSTLIETNALPLSQATTTLTNLVNVLRPFYSGKPNHHLRVGYYSDIVRPRTRTYTTFGLRRPL